MTVQYSVSGVTVRVFDCQREPCRPRRAATPRSRAFVKVSIFSPRVVARCQPSKMKTRSTLRAPALATPSGGHHKAPLAVPAAG